MSVTEQVLTQVVNLALGHAGISKPIQDINTAKEVEAVMARTFIDVCRQEVLREFPWYFAQKQINPSLIVNQPTPEWLFAYQYPSDALRLSRFMSWRLANDTRQSRVSYRVMKPVTPSLSTLSPQPASYTNTTGLWIFTNWPGVNSALPTILEYTFDNTDVADWPADFIMALSLKLAITIVPTITSGDPYGMQAKIQANYDIAINKAQANNLNEEQRPEEPQSEFIRTREGDQYGYMGMQWVAEPAGFSVQ